MTISTETQLYVDFAESTADMIERHLKDKSKLQIVFDCDITYMNVEMPYICFLRTLMKEVQNDECATHVIQRAIDTYYKQFK